MLLSFIVTMVIMVMMGDMCMQSIMAIRTTIGCYVGNGAL